MPTPFFPNELVTHIFESLYTSLRSNPLYYPISINSIFARFTLVDKRWRSLSLPFLVRHYDRPSTSIQGFLDFINEYNLTKEVKSIHFAFEIPTPKSFMERQRDLIDHHHGAEIREYEEHGAEETIEAGMYEWIPETAGATGKLVVEDRMKEVDEERRQWLPLISDYMAYVTEIEVGKRSKDENHDDNLEDGMWAELCDTGEYGGAPGEDVLEFLDKITGPHVNKLRVNLPSISLAEIFTSTPSNFPLLRDLTIYQYSSDLNDFDMFDAPIFPIWSNLQRLSIINISSDSNSFYWEISESFLEASADTLTHLELKMYTRPRSERRHSSQERWTSSGMFGSISFPSIISATLKLRNLPRSEEEKVKRLFSNAKHFSLEVERET